MIFLFTIGEHFQVPGVSSWEEKTSIIHVPRATTANSHKTSLLGTFFLGELSEMVISPEKWFISFETKALKTPFGTKKWAQQLENA